MTEAVAICALKSRLTEDMKNAMRAKESNVLGVIRLILAAVKQKEVDERIVLTDTDVLAILEKMLKQRKESIAQYEKAERQDLADQEHYEVSILKQYLPESLPIEEVKKIIAAAIAETGASSAKDMGNVMKIVRPTLQGKADMSEVSALIKEQLS
jgi:uncharacterized protein YqeY